MPAIRSSFQLVAPRDAEDWTAYHGIRRRVLFEKRGRIGVYDPNHPDETEPGNFPLVLVKDGSCIGVVRIDVRGEVAQLRRVAIDEPWQRKGFGRHLLRLAEAFSAQRGAKRVESAVALDAASFYEACGYRRVAALEARSSSVRMSKSVVPAA